MVTRTARRSFLKTGIALVPGVAIAAAPVRFVGNPAAPGGHFFNAGERDFVEAAIARLIPADDLGPGAKEAGVGDFIDSQLAGPYGAARTWYMQGPWSAGTPEQGWQSKLGPAQMYRAAIAATEAHCAGQYGGRRFAQLDAATQDKLLHDLEKGDIQLAQADAKAFFELLWQNTQEGFLADPMYGGNRGFAGWKLIGFPGPRYNYVEEIKQYGKRYTQQTVGLLGRDPDRRTA
jgi:gluconate 2-dehydrogenase gamma chain